MNHAEPSNQSLSKQALLRERMELQGRLAEIETLLNDSEQEWLEVSANPHNGDPHHVPVLGRSPQSGLVEQPFLSHHSADYYRNILANAVPGFFQSTRDGRYLVVNQSMAQLLGYESPAALLQTVTDIRHQVYVNPEQRDQFLALIDQQTRITEYEYQAYTQDGSMIWIAENARVVKDANEQIQYIEGTCIDITERKQAEVAFHCIKTELEQIVDERTAALQASNEQLVMEVAERQQAEDALRAAHDQLQAILDAVPGIVSWITADLKYLGVNRHLAGVFDLPADAFIGQDIGFLGSGPAFRDFMEDFFKNPNPDIIEQVPAVVKGVRKIYLIVAQKYDHNRAAFIVGIDITERYRAEEALRKTEAKYRAIFENAVEGIFQTSMDGKYLSANPSLARIYGYDNPEDLLHSLTDIKSQLYVDVNRREEFIGLLQKNGAIVHFESQIYRRDGTLLWISENARVVYEDDGTPLYYEGTVEDITELKTAQEELQRAKQELETRVEERTAALKSANDRLMIEIQERQRAEEALRSSEAELRALFAAMPDVITVFDSEGRYCKTVSTNSALLYKPEVDRSGKTIYDILPPRQAMQFAIHIQRALNTGHTVNLEYSLPISANIDKSPDELVLRDAWYNASVSPLPNKQVLWVARNITERKQAEQALARAEEKYRSIFENAAEGIFQTTPDGRCLSVNPALAKMYGYGSPAEFIAKGVDLAGLYVDPNRRLEFIRRLDESDALTKFESQAYRKDRSIFWISENARVVRDAQGLALYYEGTVEDITQRRKSEEALRRSELKERERSQQLAQTLQELQQTQTKLVQSEKMSSLGQMMAGVAHEINNPVNFIYGNLAYASRYIEDLLRLIQAYQTALPEPPEPLQQDIDAVDLNFILQDLPKLLSSMYVGAERIREIVRSLRNFSRHDEAELKEVDIHEGIDSTLMILQHRLKSDARSPEIQVHRHYGDVLPIRCYAGQMNQVFMNILSNAVDALRDASVGSENAPATMGDRPPMITIQTQMMNRDRLQITIADNGPGIPQHIQQRMFDPFFTTKEIGKGTGLGLSISHQIITERHEGHIHCHSTPEQGTQFIIEIPLNLVDPKG